MPDHTYPIEPTEPELRVEVHHEDWSRLVRLLQRVTPKRWELGPSGRLSIHFHDGTLEGTQPIMVTVVVKKAEERRGRLTAVHVWPDKGWTQGITIEVAGVDNGLPIRQLKAIEVPL